jgi:uncharacterized cupredoxin-like copper-binding protein
MRKSTESTGSPGGRCSALAAVAIAALAGLAIAGCGGGDNGGTTTAAQGSATTTPAGGGSTVKMSETEYKLQPSDPSVKAGTVTFDVTNDGQVTHSLEVEGPGVEEELASDLAPGDGGTLTVDLSKPGKYELYCPIDNHKQLGMEGTLTVR